MGLVDVELIEVVKFVACLDFSENAKIYITALLYINCYEICWKMGRLQSLQKLN